MKPILVPGPPKQAFNKHRRMSDLIKAQIVHLKHLEEKMPQQVRETLPQHAIVTENDAAQYIAAMTRHLISQTAAVPQPKPRKEPTPIRPSNPISLAASASVTKKSAPRKPKAGHATVQNKK